MLNNGRHSKNLDYASLLLVVIFSFGLLLFTNSTDNHSGSSKRSNQTQISLSQSSACITSGINFQYLQKSWISNKDNFELLSFGKTQFLDNKKADQKILLQENIRKNSINIPIIILQHHLFTSPPDDPTILS